MKHWHLLHIKPNLAEMFQNPPILAFCQNKNLRDIGTKLIEKDKVKRKFTNCAYNNDYKQPIEQNISHLS